MTALNGPIGALSLYRRRLAGSRTPVGGSEASASIGPETAGTFNPATGEYAADSVAAVWTGPVLVTAVGADQVVDFGDGPTSLRAYEIELIDPAKTSAAVQVEHVVVLSSSQAGLDGLKLRVLDVRDEELAAHIVILGEAVQHGG